MTAAAWILFLTCPNPLWTPGATFPTASPTVICASGYTARVRHVDDAAKVRACKRYSASACPGPGWEIDHYVPLELGGSNDDSNLWPQPIEEARVKDTHETHLHHLLCATPPSVTLQAAQAAVRDCQGWLKPAP